MTVEKIETVVALIDEMSPENVGSVYAFQGMGGKAFAVFPKKQIPDVYNNDYVINPVLIWENGKFLNEYEYLNNDQF